MTAFEKIRVTAGIYWVGIPDADLYVLCGCPADSVKHLIRQGLIVTKEQGGVSFETGPNAILLSDVAIQHGSFSNLAEFPTLQMLYRQGMLLPNHPNNTGRKPLLMGQEDQIDAQLEYIYRGNYGLTSQEEIMATGVPEDRAKEMMEMKLRFAFGHIRKTEELLDTLEVPDDFIEIRNDVFIRRLNLNYYEFSYKDETITVDLNLAPNEDYQPPYQLDYHRVRREYFAIIHSGEGDGWDIHRPCMASILVFQGKIYLIDAGPNIQQSLMTLGIDINEIEGIFHTHCHDDHFAGLTALIRTDRRIKYFATPLVRASVIKKLTALMVMGEKRFGEYFEIRDLDWGWNNVDGLEVCPIFSPHPVETNIFLFRALWEDRYPTYAHFADIISLAVLEKMIKKDESDVGITREFFEQIKADYLTPADVKKIDIGGGLIHGMAEDFRDDPSEKIILAHTALSLDSSQKEIGSEAAFGSVEVLIPAAQNYTMRYASDCLAAYFPSVPYYELRALLNCPVVPYNAGSILLKKDVIADYIYLILSGSVEFIQSENEVLNLLSSGSLVGELSGLMETPTQGTYRTATAIYALQLPAEFYREFARRNNLYEDIEKSQLLRTFLQRTWLFGEMISSPTQNRIVRGTTITFHPEGEVIPLVEEPILYLLEEGILNICYQDDILETLSPGDFFGEETVLAKSGRVFEVVAAEPSRICRIPGPIIEEIPIVRWKLLQTFEARMKVLGNYVSHFNGAVWEFMEQLLD